MLSGWFSWFIIFWGGFLIAMLSIGGFFMFRKFLKRLPKEDGMSILDWENFYLEKTYHLWTPQQKQLLESLVAPVPELFRDIARNKIAGRIGELALTENASLLTEELIIKGYIYATPKRDHKFLVKALEKENIDYLPYKDLLS